jgi:hypothetical protein
VAGPGYPQSAAATGLWGQKGDGLNRVREKLIDHFVGQVGWVLVSGGDELLGKGTTADHNVDGAREWPIV